MVSPLLTLNAGTAGSPADVTAGSSVAIALANATGVNYWSVSITACDDQNTVAAISATLAVNQGAKTATVTAPASLGSCFQITSVVGINGLGLDANSKANSTFTTTTKVNVLTASGLRVIFPGETNEQDPTFYWAKVVDAAIRAGLPIAQPSLAVAMSTGTITPTAANNYLKLTGSLTGNNTLVLGATDGKSYWVDATQITFNAHTITLQSNSVNWGTTISASGMWQVFYNGAAGKLYGLAMTP